MDTVKNLRNLLILLALAAAVEFLPGGGRAATTVETLLIVIFAAGIGWFGYRFYRERHLDLYGLGDRYRGLLYGAVAVAFLALTARLRMWESSVGEFIWLVLVGLVLYALVLVYRRWRTY